MKKFIMLCAVISLVIFTGAMCSTETTNTNTTSENKNTVNENSVVVTNETVTIYEYMDITPVEAQDLIDTTPNLTIIDVSPNYDEGHLPGSVNYYVGDGSLDEAIPTLDKNTPYLVYCHFESASRAGAQALTDAGFIEVYRLEGDYPAWVDAGYEVE